MVRLLTCPWLPVEILETVFVSRWDNSWQSGANRSEIAFQLNENRLVISVQDNGSGIFAGNRGQVFTPLFTTQRDKGETGLGLSITLQLLETYQGNIHLADLAGVLYLNDLPLSPVS